MVRAVLRAAAEMAAHDGTPPPACAQIAGQPCGQSDAVVMDPFLAGRPGDDLAGQGRDRARHRDRAGADRRRRTRCRYRPRADGPRIDGGKPQRGRHLGQSFRPAVRTRHPAGLRRSPADLSRSGVGPARCRESMRSTSATAPSPGPAMSGPATGNSPTTSRSIVTRRRAPCRRHRRNAALPAIRFSASIFPTRCSRIRASFTISALPGMLHGRVLRPELSAAKLRRAAAKIARACDRRPRRHRARRQFRRRGQRDRGLARRPHSTRCAKARHGRPAKRCPMKTSWRSG